MKFVERILLGFIIFLFTVNAAIILSGRTYLYKGLVNTYFQGRSGPSINEEDIFYNRRVKVGDPEPWPKHSEFGQHQIPGKEREYLRSIETVSFLVFEQDSLLFEKYWEGYNKDSLTNSFSVAKSIVNVLTGIALKEGLIDSIGQRVGEFLPYFNEGERSKITLRHLMTMSSGLNWSESGGNPFSHNAEAYYGDDLEGIVKELKAVKEPGKEFNYQSGNTLILGMVLEKATGRKLAYYAGDKLWSEVGATHPALWNLDRKDGQEKAFCCFYSIPRDLARIGKLYLHEGEYNGKEIVPSTYVQRSLSPATLLKDGKGEAVDFYGYFWWLKDHGGKKVYYARGILGQYIIIVPSEEMIIVRTGRKRGMKRGSMHPSDVGHYLDIALGMVDKNRTKGS